MKKCSKCKNVKQLSEFKERSSSKDGLRGQCIECYAYNRKKNRYNIKPKSKSPGYKICFKCNNEKPLSDFYNRKDSKDGHSGVCGECFRIRTRNNKEKNTIYKKDYYKKNKPRLIRRGIDNNNKRRKVDILFRIRTNISSSISVSIRRNGYKKKSRTHEILGCSFEEFKLHLESKFEGWMSWDNYGKYNGELNYGWDIDHIIPTSSSINEEGLIKLNHYTNLQPLCSKVNRDIKINKILC